MVSALCASSDPLSVATALCAHCASRQLYVADLDALLGTVPQVAVLRRLLQALPELELWLDAGFASRRNADALRGALGPAGARVVPVFGSESLASRVEFERCFGGSTAPASDAMLSLDRRDGRHLDAAGCWETPALWPTRVIVMTLERVGSHAGPDLETFARVRQQSPDTFLVGAGGVRNEDDLARARDAGAGAWLVASALHDGFLPRVAA